MKLSACLSALGITDAALFAECDDCSEEFKVIKKLYFKKILREHPDKGGDPATFRATQAAWEVVRDQHEKGIGSFASHLGGEGDEEEEDDAELDELYKKYSANTGVPSYEFYEEAAEEEVPGYKVETAKSGRSKCTKCESKIAKDEIRVGSLDKTAGTYGRWHHLQCWRVPGKVQNGLTDHNDEATSLTDLLSMEEVLLTGVGALSDANKLLFVQHCVNSGHWAKNKKRKQIMGDTGTTAKGAKGAKVASKSQSASKAAASSGGANNIVAGSFVVLVPGVDGAEEDQFLKGKTFLTTGVFPEAGGGDEDCIGVANVKAMIESFGGKVITRFSKNTNFLLVGRDPPANKIKDANKRSVQVISLRRLQGLLTGNVTFDALAGFPALTNDDFTANYQPAGPAAPAKASAKPSANTSAKATSTKKPAAKKPAAKKPAAAAAKAPPVWEILSDDEDSKPAAATTSASTQAIVAHANPTGNGTTTTAVVPRDGKVKFTVPRPGVKGAVAGVLDGKRFVLTGTFPELGGGTGLSLGKDKTKSMIESFGGTVTSAVSGKTDFVLVGKDPGKSKVSAAEKKDVPMITLVSLQPLLMGQKTLESTVTEAIAEPPRITGFSAGYPKRKQIEY